MGTNGDVREENAMAWHQCARTHGFLEAGCPLKFTTTQAVHETSFDDESTSTETVVDWYNYCREVCADRIMNHHAGQIGGPGRTVEVWQNEVQPRSLHRRTVGFRRHLPPNESLLPCSVGKGIKTRSCRSYAPSCCREHT